MNIEDISIEFIKKYDGYFRQMLVAMTMGKLKRRYIPELELDASGSESYHDPNRGIIHIGLNRQDMFDSIEEMFAFVSFLLGHEVQHALSTSKKPWDWAINTGTKIVVNYYLERAGKPRLGLATNEEVIGALERLRKAGKHVPTFRVIQDFCHMIVNVLEDGRIERQRAAEYSGFAKYVRYFRGKIWLDDKNLCVPIDHPMNAKEVFDIVMSNYFSLSTSHVYMRGYYDTVRKENQTVRELVDSMIPMISEGIYATHCKHCMNWAVKLIEKLTPFFAAACDEEPAADFMYSLLSKTEIVQNSVSERPENEEEATDSYDVQYIQNDDLDKPELSEDGKLTGRVTQNEAVSEKSEEAVIGPTVRNIGNADGETSTKKKGHTTNNRSRGRDTSQFNMDELLREIDAAAKTAVENLSASYGMSADNIPDIFTVDEDSTHDTAITAAERYDCDFVEVERRYEVDIDLPDIVLMQAQDLKERIKDKFRVKKTGFIKNRTDGSINPEQLYKLAMNQFDCFQTPKKPETFSGCCYILQDNSGSMGFGHNSKRQFASEATARIEYAFKDYMPLKITAYDSAGKVIHDVIKDWGDSTSKSCSMSFFMHGRDGSCNEDYYDILIATDELLARTEKNKILIVISDGAPGGQLPGYKNAKESVRYAVSQARAQGIIVCGIFIEEQLNRQLRDEYMEMYGSNIVFTDSDSIGDRLSELMENWILTA